MENRKNNDISADELLEKLSANLEEEQNSSGTKKYKFRRSERITAHVNEDAHREGVSEDAERIFESPVPHSDIEGLDIDALMKMYLPEEDYERMSERERKEEVGEDFVKTLSSIEISAEGEDENGGLSDTSVDLAAPDTELYDHLSEGGKVCDVPELEKRDEMSDTRQAPLRPMSDIERTIAYGSVDPDGDEGGFISVRELMAIQNKSEDTEAEVFDAESTASFSVTEEEEDDDSCDGDEDVITDGTKTVSFDAFSRILEEASSLSVDDTEDTDVENTAEDDAEVDYFSDDEEDDESLYEEFSDTAVNEAVNDAMLKMGIFGNAEDDAEDELNGDEEQPVTVAETEDNAEELAHADGEAEVGETDTEPVLADPYAEFSDIIGDSDEFDETDANIMLAFGMDEELEQTLGKESADKLRSEVDADEDEENGESKKPVIETESVKEFVSTSEIKSILESYKNEYGRSALKLFALIAVAVVLFFYENLGVFGGSLPDALKVEYYPIVNVMLGLQLLLIGFAVLYRDVIKGAKALFVKKPQAESYLPVMLAVSVIYSVCACFFPAGSNTVSFHFPIAMALLFHVIGKRLDLRREIMTFRVISSKRGKFALERLDIIDAELETKAFDKFLPKQPDIFRINKTSFIDGYFRRTNAYSSIKEVLIGFIPASLVAAVIGILVGFIATKSLTDAVMIGYASFAFATPAVIFLAFSLPMFRASKVCFDNGSAIVGEGALDEYTSASSISFDDREVFPTSGVKLKSVKVFGSGRLDNVIYYMASVYSFIGGPLADVLNVATADLGRSEDVELLELDADGVEAVVDGHRVYVGKDAYLRHNGYLPITDPEDEEIEGGDICIIFLVCDDEVVGKLYVRYRIDPEFQNTLKSLYRSGICVGIKTVDPNINDEMLGTRIKLTKYPVRVLKYDDISDRSRGNDRTDSGIVSRKNVKALLSAFTLCDKTKHVTKTNLIICALTVLIGVVITACVSFMGSIGAVGSVYVALFQLFWLIPVYLISRFLLM